jgi:hypothetical protein
MFRRCTFFTVMSLVLLAVVIAGFARTFYLRELFDVPPIPPHVYVHGVVLTAWFVWFVLQSSLVTAARVDLHRRLGIAGAALGLAVIVVSVMTVMEMGPRLRFLLHRGILEPEVLAKIVWGDVGSISSFAALLTLGLAFRRQPGIHKRLMFLASVSLVGPAAGRIAGWPLNLSPVLLAAATFLLLLASLLVYDMANNRRMHPATLAGGGFRILTWVGAAWAGGTEWGQAVVHSLNE